MSTWMVVEDEPDLYELVLAMYELLGIDGVSFTTGEEAVDWIDDVDAGNFDGELPDVALLDVRLPGDIDGPTIGERLRKSPALRNVKIVLMTAYRLNPAAESEMVQRASADRLLYKPFPALDEFKQIMTEVQHRKRTKKTR